MSTDGYTGFGFPPHFISADGNHRDANSFVTSPNHNASPNQPLAGILGAITTQDQHIAIWSPKLSPSNHGSQQQALSTANSGWNNGWNPDASIAPPAWDPASQEFTQSSSHVTTGFDQRFIPAWSSADYPSVHSNGITNSQPDPTLQLPDFDVTPNGFANSELDPTLQLPDFGVTHNGFTNSQPDPTLQLLDFGVTPDGIANSQPDVTPNGFANFNSFIQWDDSTAIDPQATMTSFNQWPFPTTTSMPAAPALPTHATSMFTAPAVPCPIARRVASRRSNVNTNPHTCNYPGCRKSFARPSDLVRHTQQHGVPLHPCPVHGCNRRGSRAFYRADKLRDHQRKKHRMAI